MTTGSRPRALIGLVMAALLASCTGVTSATAPSPPTTPATSAAIANPKIFLLSTTTTRDTGVLDALEADFEQRTGYDVIAIVAGSGEVLELGRRGEGDVLLTHSPAAEEEFVADGHGVRREIVMHNDFVIVGPPNDPARIQGMEPTEALQNIATASAPFVSRGDDSGTHVKELSLWEDAGADPAGQSWYTETGSGQGQTLNVASERGAYALADRGTYLALQENLDLDILVERTGGASLLNIYHVMTVDPTKSSKINATGANAFADYITSPDGQSVISTVGVAEFGEPLFVPDAGKTLEEVIAELG